MTNPGGTDTTTVAESSVAAASMDIAYRLNGREVTARVEARQLLVHHLREDQLLTGTHIGCDTSQCGACAVRIDGRIAKACSVLACQVEGSEVTTIEGLSCGATTALTEVQEAFRRHHALQCGFCTPGMVMTATELLESGRPLADDEVRHALTGNICRCTGYQNIVRAIVEVAHERLVPTAVAQ